MNPQMKFKIKNDGDRSNEVRNSHQNTILVSSFIN